MGIFPALAHEDFALAAETLARYRLSNLAISRQTDRESRGTFLRDQERKDIPEMQLSIRLLSHFRPNLAKRRANLQGPPFEESATPPNLQTYTSDLRCLGGS